MVIYVINFVDYFVSAQLQLIPSSPFRLSFFETLPYFETTTGLNPFQKEGQAFTIETNLIRKVGASFADCSEHFPLGLVDWNLEGLQITPNQHFPPRETTTIPFFFQVIKL